MSGLKKSFLIYCLILMQSQIVNANQLTPEDYKKIKAQCLTTIRAADSLIGKQAEEITQLKVINGKLTGQIDHADQKLRDLENPSWYSRKTTVFLLGALAGGLLYGKITNP